MNSGLKNEPNVNLASGNPRKKRKVIRTTIEFKKEIIQKFESGVQRRELSTEYNMPRSTLSTILKNKEIIKAADVAKGVKSVSSQRSPLLEEVEKLLLVWVNKQQLDGTPLSEPMICKKAKVLFEDLLKTKGESSEGEIRTFKASHGWYENFKKRSGINKPDDPASHSANQTSSERFKNEFKNHVNEEKLFPQQVFSCNDVMMFWKKLPQGTFITQEELTSPGYRPMKDKVTLLLCSNASGDLKLRPLLVYHSENPRAFGKKRVNKANLPVLWKSHPKGWITKQLFIEWMNEVFGPSVKSYLLEKNLPLKVLFVLDNTTAHPVDLENSLSDDFSFISMRFLPSDCALALRPLNEDILENFKKLYLKVLLQQCLTETSRTGLGLREFWKYHLNILYCIHLIGKAWDEVSNVRLNSAWKVLWPEGVFKTEYEILGTESAAIMEDILQLAHSLCLEMNEGDVVELLLGLKEEFTTKDLQELIKEQERLILVEIPAGVEGTTRFPISLIRDVCTKWAEVQHFVEKYHPDKHSTNEIVRLMNDKVFDYFRDIVKMAVENKN